MHNGKRILLAEDDAQMRGLLHWSLEQEGYHVDDCTNGAQLFYHLVRRPMMSVPSHYDLIISDVRMPGLSGLEALEGAKQVASTPPLILISAFGDDLVHELARQIGALAFFDKPFEIELLIDKVRDVIPR